MGTDVARAPALLEVSGLRVSYGRTKALVDVSLTVDAGQVHALIGENGSGKSTLVKTISGIVRPGGGTLAWQGDKTDFRGPHDAQRRGIVTVFQETLVADELSVFDNLSLGMGGMFRSGASRSAVERSARKQLGRLGLGDLDLDLPVWRLPLSRRHLVAITRALMRPWRLLLLDEATSALDIEDRQRLFAVIREGAAEGRGVLYISHRMDEIEALADKLTVLRSGQTVGVMDRESVSRMEMIRLMSPPTRALRETAQRDGPMAVDASSAPPALWVMGARLTDAAQPFDLSVRPGEVLGLAGLEGHGQARFLRCLAGWEDLTDGEVLVPETTPGAGTHIRTPRDAHRAHIAYVPGDRKRDGIFAALSVEDNFTLPVLGQFARGGVLNIRRLRRSAEELSARMRVKMQNLDAAIETLSGGNQQKVVLGRWIAASPRVMLLDDSMRGVDVNSKAEIMTVLMELVADGVALVLLSTEVEELVDLCHRVAVFREQSLFRVLDRAQIAEETVVAAILGESERP